MKRYGLQWMGIISWEWSKSLSSQMTKLAKGPIALRDGRGFYGYPRNLVNQYGWLTFFEICLCYANNFPDYVPGICVVSIGHWKSWLGGGGFERGFEALLSRLIAKSFRKRVDNGMVWCKTLSDLVGIGFLGWIWFAKMIYIGRRKRLSWMVSMNGRWQLVNRIEMRS